MTLDTPSLERSSMAAVGRWLFLAGALLMVTGDGPAATIRVSRWPSPVPALAWEWLYLALLGGAVLALAWGGRLRPWKLPHLAFIAPAVAAVTSALLLATAFSQVHLLSLEACLALLGVIGFAWVASLLLEDPAISRASMPVLATAILLLAFRVVVWRRDEGLDVIAFQVANNAWLGKLQLAWVFNLCAPLLLARFLGERRWPLVALYGLSWAGAAVATYLLFSRMGIVVFGLTAIAVFLLNRASWRRSMLILAAAAALGSVPAVRSIDTFRTVAASVLERDRYPGVDMRLGAWRDALRLFRAHPVTGIGPGTFDEVAFSLPETSAAAPFRGQGWHAHNVYLHVLAETGLPGLAAWCFLWYLILARLVRAWRRSAPALRHDAAGALGAVIAFLVLSTTEVLIAARVHASLRMNLTIALVVALGLHLAIRGERETLDSQRRLH